MTSSTDTVVAFLREHSLSADEIKVGTDGVWAVASYSTPFGPGREWQLVGTSIREAREWLGY